MPTKDPRLDAYIAKSQPFAQPILRHLRELIHAACPAVEETIKWQMPHFMYHGILANIAGFKQHCTLFFFHPEMRRSVRFGNDKGALGQFGRLTSLADLPSDAVLTQLIKTAMKHNEAPRTPRPKRPAKPVVVPAYFSKALKQNPKSLANFQSMPPSHRREYVQWITDAKRDETRARRMATAIKQLADGKSQNWKYEK